MKRAYVLIAIILCIAAGSATTALYVAQRTSTDRSQTPKKQTAAKRTVPPAQHEVVEEQTPQQPVFDKARYSTTDPTSIWVIANKTHPLTPQSYSPSDLRLPKVSQRTPGGSQMRLRNEAATALEVMFKAASDAGYSLMISSAFRDYSYQKAVYSNYVASDGVAQADTYSARPGYSEHQTGLALDIRAKSNACTLKQCFGDLAEGKWLAANSYKYGFILRYTKNKEAITGYHYEPWHFRYVGIALATEMHNQGIETLEEFFGVTGGKVYN